MGARRVHQRPRGPPWAGGNALLHRLSLGAEVKMVKGPFKGLVLSR